MHPQYPMNILHRSYDSLLLFLDSPTKSKKQNYVFCFVFLILKCIANVELRAKCEI